MVRTIIRFRVLMGIMKNICFWFLLFLVSAILSGNSLAGVEAEEILVGITWADSRLVSFDPHSGVIKEKHAQLNPYEGFLGLAYDPNQNKLYALSQVENNLYSIDPDTLDISHIGNLHIDKGIGTSVRK